MRISKAMRFVLLRIRDGADCAGFPVTRRALRRNGLIAYDASGHVIVTDTGRAALADVADVEISSTE